MEDLDMFYSQGPWEVHENCVRTAAPGRCVARLDWDIRDAVDDANARLIAAAPDLLEVVQAMASFDGRNNNAALKRMAVLAYAKAIGEKA